MPSPELPIVLSIVEIIVLLIAFASGIAVPTLIGRSKSDFIGDCILYADVTYTSPSFFRVTPGSIGKCSYCIGVQSIAIIVALLYATYRTIVLITNKFDVKFIFKWNPRLNKYECCGLFILITFVIKSQFLNGVGRQDTVTLLEDAALRFICVPVYALFTLMLLIQAFIVSVGLKHFCSALKSEPSYVDVDCKVFQTVDWQYYTGSRFYDTLKMAEGASWVSFFSWCILLVLGVFSAYKYRQYTKMTSSLVDK